jgi:cell division protein FtsL
MATALKGKGRALDPVKRARVVRISRHERRRHLLAIACLFLVVLSLALLYVWLRLQVVHMGYLLSATSKLRAQLEQENRELRVELASMTSPDRLEAMARRRLRLIPPEKGQVVILP